jgi:hypothetical protein
MQYRPRPLSMVEVLSTEWPGHEIDVAISLSGAEDDILEVAHSLPARV